MNIARWPVIVAGLVAGVGQFSLGAQGIPEPDMILYGVLRNVTSNLNLRIGHGSLTCVLEPDGGGNPITISTTLANINDQFSYALRIPCETLVPGFAASPNTVPLAATPVAYRRGRMLWNGTNQVSFELPDQVNTTVSRLDRGRVERADLTVSAPVEFGANGLPVDWQLLYFGRKDIDPNLDSDGDGLTDGEEYRTGTNPLNPLSGLRFTEVRSVPGGIQMKWAAVNGKTYALQRATSLGGEFVDLETGLAGTPPINTYLDSDIGSGGPFFYRLRIDDSPALSPIPILRLASLSADPEGGLRLAWGSTANQRYSVQRSSNLSLGFVTIVTNLPATPPTNSFHDPGANGFGPFFYRLKLEP